MYIYIYIYIYIYYILYAGIIFKSKYVSAINFHLHQVYFFLLFIFQHICLIYFIFSLTIYIYIQRERDKRSIVRKSTKSLGYLGSITGRAIPDTQKMILDSSLNYSHHYHVRIKSKRSNLRKEVVPSIHTSVVAIEKVAFGRPIYIFFKYTSVSRHPIVSAWCRFGQAFRHKL